jgi:hypothetical protein
VPDEWTATRIAAYLHRAILAPLGFGRAGTTCTRPDMHLTRTIRFYALPAGTPRVQMWMSVSLVGLPDALTPYRRDGLWGFPAPISGRGYPRPPRDQPLPAELVADVAGPAVEFLTHVQSLGDFVAWAQQIYTGDRHRGWWHRFQPVMPQGTAPLQTAAYAAALMHNTALATRLADQILAEETNTEEAGAFQTEFVRLLARTP